VEELRFQVTVDSEVPTLNKETVCFETGANPQQVGPGVYEHHGDGFDQFTPGALTRLFEDLILGTRLPLTLSTTELRAPDTILAIALFLDRSLLILPATPGLVYGVDLAHRFGPQLLSHLDPIVSGFFKAFPRFFTPNLTKRESGDRITLMVKWIHEYLTEGNTPNLGGMAPEVRVLDVGTNGFVLAESLSLTFDAWEVLYRDGYLRGILLGPEVEGRRLLLASRKSERSWEGLPKTVPFLNELEALSGGVPEWQYTGDFVYSPPVGTTILVSHLLKVFLGI
jgi:hypothetical protein